jgi:hypothetical protein
MLRRRITEACAWLLKKVEYIFWFTVLTKQNIKQQACFLYSKVMLTRLHSQKSLLFSFNSCCFPFKLQSGQ